MEKKLRAMGEDEAADEFAGYGTSLKPAHEPIVLARRPLSESSVARQVLQNGCGAINIEATRVNGKRWGANLMLSHVGGPNGCRPTGEMKRVKSDGHYPPGSKIGSSGVYGQFNGNDSERRYTANPDGTEEVAEWICARDEDGNYICPMALLDEQGRAAGVHSAGAARRKVVSSEYSASSYDMSGDRQMNRYEDKGNGSNPSRFFQQFHPDTHPGFIYKSKASRRDRSANGTVENKHPTCKNTELMKYLLTLVVPPGGVVLDPFAGSGSTLVAATLLNIRSIGIEKEAEYIPTIEGRLKWAQEQVEPKNGKAPVQSPESSNQVESDEETYPGALPMCPICKDAPIASGRGMYQCGHNLYYEDEIEALKETLF